ncbi:hypothetical protein [Sulfuritalea sp.]|uniref:hypothetical protein n=1 Tax=Sulfuritalea sp. TaxID=2480090 RepID=UPI001AC77B36|nr:hypothetical protein [Sulfuritalea sp.]MBN8476774.1 hypothetical protein [Sulfuritalea sp.]
MSIEDLIRVQPPWTLAAVFLGFMLGEGSRYIRERLRVFRLKRTIQKELESIQRQIPQKKEIVSQIIGNLGKRVLLPGLSVPIISLGYDELIKAVYEHLSPLQRNCLHVIYERLRVADNTLANFKDDFLAMIKAGVLADPWKAFADQFQDINASYDVVEDLIASYLSNRPIDVFMPSRM